MTVRPVLFDFPEYGPLGYFATAESFSLLVRQLVAVLYLFVVRENIKKKVRRKHAIWRYTLTYGLLDALILAMITLNTIVRSRLFELTQDPAKNQEVLYS